MKCTVVLDVPYKRSWCAVDLCSAGPCVESHGTEMCPYSTQATSVTLVIRANRGASENCQNLWIGNFYYMAPRKPAKRLKHLNLRRRANIVAWSKAGLNTRVMAAWIGQDTVILNQIINKTNPLRYDDIPARKLGSGRPRLTSCSCWRGR
jgi:hypothetical protein